MTIQELLRSCCTELSPLCGDCAQYEAETLLCHVLDCDRAVMYGTGSHPVSESVLSQVQTILKRRKNHEPLPYILGRAAFHSCELRIGPGALIPRPETEILVETVLNHEGSPSALFLDVGTGPGTITAALLHNRPSWYGIATDISFRALAFARQNCPGRCSLVLSDGLTALKHIPRFDFIVANPPYIPSATVSTLDSSVREHEPLEALDGGSDGLVWYRLLASTLHLYLKPKGRLYCEIGADQGEAVGTIFSGGDGWHTFAIFPDLNRRPRVVRVCAP